MVRKKPNIKADITEAQKALRAVMTQNLSKIAENMIGQIMSKVGRLTPSTQLDAIKDISPVGVAEYRTALLDALAVIASDALDKARKEVPAKKNLKLAGEEDSIQLGEFERLPAALRKKVTAQSRLLVDTQIADIEKAVYFQFTSSVDSTDSLLVLQDDLYGVAEDYIDGATVYAGANATAANMVNSARNAFFLDDEVTAELDAFVFTNGDPVSPICKDLDKTVFSADDPNLNRYWPPLHWNCKSYILPILKGNLGSREIKALNPKPAAQASIQFGESGKCSCGCDRIENEMVLTQES